jgi:hypothetical protein
MWIRKFLKGWILLIFLAIALFSSSVAGPDPGSGIFFTLDPGSGMGKKSGSEMKNPDHVSQSLETIFLG